ncbi:MAG: hypothetical protein KBF75_12850 [Saprospiraceae bacterium]|mgnify:FL=1|nr:hypothetical protein [Saprospiraceae bacterium]HQW94759.1 hypothetical protein [Saprospiraceae bacterium]
MKIKIFMIGLIAITISSCTSARYLPSSDNIDVNEYGSYIKIIHKTSESIKGELIAFDSSKIVVLEEETKKCVKVPITDIQKFKLRYAQPKHYGWTILAYTLATIGHGIFMAYTAPINLIVTISVTVSGETAFQYSDKNITYDILKMFARFPQGIPPNMDLASIK